MAANLTFYCRFECPYLDRARCRIGACDI